MKCDQQGHWRCVGLLILQLAISGQLVWALMVESGGFERPDGLTPSGVGAGCEWVCTAVVLCVYSPLPLTLFSCLALLLGVCFQDVPALCFAVMTQALGSASMFLGLAMFSVASGSFLRPADLTAAFYLCMCTMVEMAAVAAMLAWSSRGRLASCSTEQGSGLQGISQSAEGRANQLRQQKPFAPVCIR